MNEPRRLAWFRGATASLLFTLAGCSGGGSQPATSPNTASIQRALTAPIHISLAVSPALASIIGHVQPQTSMSRSIKYISPSTSALVATLAPPGSSSAQTQTFDCTMSVCTADFSGTVGIDTLSLELTDGLTHGNHALSISRSNVAVVAGVTNTFHLTANGVVDHVALSVGIPSINAGLAQVVSISLTAYDADNNIIVGPGNYVDATGSPLTFTFAAQKNDATAQGTGNVTLSSSSTSSPSQAPMSLTYDGGWLDNVSISVIAPPAIAARSAATSAAIIPIQPSATEFTAGFSGATRLGGIAVGADGNFWIADPNHNAIDRMTPSGSVTIFPIGHAASAPWDVVAGPDGNIWFTARNGFAGTDGAIGSMTSTGAVTLYTGGSIAAGSPFGITVGPDQAIWFTESGNQTFHDGSGKIGRITTAGVLTEYSAGISSYALNGIAVGPDGALWFAEAGSALGSNGSAKIGRIMTTGSVTEFTLPAGTYNPHYIVLGPDGNLWFTEYENSNIGRVTPAGAFTMFSSGLPGPGERGIVVGQDGYLWTPMSSLTGDTGLCRISTSGAITYYPNATASTSINGSAITVGPDGNLWTTQHNGGVGRFAL